MADLTTIILTYNEELNIKECIESVKHISKRIVVIDSFSNDKTIMYAKEMGVEIFQNNFISHAKQFKYGLDISDIKTKWVFRIDADERLTKESAEEIERICTENSETDINGIVVRFEVNFLGRKLRHGGIYPFSKLLVFKYGCGEIEDRNMDEHIYLTEGKSVELKNDSLHYDYKDLTFWVDKHNKYSSKEVLDYFQIVHINKNNKKLNNSAKIKRFIKYKIYYRFPMGTRSFFYFFYRYILRFGFLDGKEGLIFAVLQAFWYRFLVDAKIYERQKYM
ncbi:glycosyltransferase family 2 protein [candidate division WWE3 bacterium]|jgi:glycosyltransferase involved in cell wall biosynthesis|uniref:Glycosyltransferase family 2 protein n=1 Tax=candidate division WWE3 bacterium TaxID=2053526 RepID=A0A3A4ZGR1_UNCKA|nr:MAG: glycosyltransferase family 2 protein [candidate division WWE3 bacterium]